MIGVYSQREWWTASRQNRIIKVFDNKLVENIRYQSYITNDLNLIELFAGYHTYINIETSEIFTLGFDNGKIYRYYMRDPYHFERTSEVKKYDMIHLYGLLLDGKFNTAKLSSIDKFINTPSQRKKCKFKKWQID